MYCSGCGGQRQEEDYIYCPNCGVKFEPSIPPYSFLGSGQSNLTEREAIEAYFNSGFEYRAILQFLSKYHGIEMSLSTLKRRLKENNLRRNELQNINMIDLERVIRSELDGPGRICGYRAMWHALRIKHSIFVPRRAVEVLLRQIDPEGVEERKRHKLKRREYRSPGPSFCWHADGYDKLKPYGFPIHGAIDGYSRRVI